MKKIITILIICLFFLVVLPVGNVSAFEKTVNDFDRIWYNPDTGFNKNGNGALVLAVTYTNNTLRTIDYCEIEFQQNPFYFAVTFSDELKRDYEGNIIEPKEGYFYLRKAVVVNYFPDDLKKLASKNLNYKTTQYNGDTWFRLYIPSFNNKYEWGEYEDADINEKWFTWGNKNSIRFQERAMFIKKTLDQTGDLEFDISHNSDNSGQRIAFNKSYLNDKGITNPVFELKNKYSYERVSYKTNSTHYLVDFSHFSEIGIHEASTGRVTGYIINDTYDTSNTITGTYTKYDASVVWDSNPSNMVDSDTGTYAEALLDGTADYQKVYDNGLSEIPSHLNITDVELRHYYDIDGYLLEPTTVHLRAYFDNSTLSASTYAYVSESGFGTSSGWSSWDSIYSDGNAPSTWTFDNVTNVSVRVRGQIDSRYETPDCKVSAVQIRVTYETESFDLNRTSGLVSESVQNCDDSENPSYYTPSISWTDNPILVFPVSNQTNAINNVTNNTCGTQATEVSSLDDVVNNTFWFDSVNKFVYIGTIDLTPSTKVNWTVNGTSGSTFSINIPTYLDMGELCFIHGKIKDADGNDLNGIEATTHVYQSGVDMITPVEWNCTGGNVQASFYTTTLEPGVYEISMEFTKDGLTFKYGETIYIATDPPSGNYIPAKLHFSYYDSNTGLGISQDKFKLYMSTDTSIDNSDRIYRDYYEDTYTGQTLYYRVDDYFDNQVYPTVGDYASFDVESPYDYVDIPITWYDVAIKNLNESIIHFSMQNESVYYNITLFPMDSVHLNVMPGDYTIQRCYYYAKNGSYIKSEPDTITISADTFYIMSGYNAMVHISWYNTNEALGLPDETLKLYIDGERQISQTYWTYINRSVNITVKDYYNTTLYSANHSLNHTYNFIDLGLTFHSWKFSNKNDDYYMISFLKDGGSRWFERGIVPYEALEFILPSGTYTLRIYDSDGTMIYNTAGLALVNSRVYMIHGTNLSEVISGLSVIRGQLLEVRDELYDATMPDIVRVGYNIPSIYSIFDKTGMSLGSILVCPALTLSAETTNTSYVNTSIVSYPLIPRNGTSENGTITIKEDWLYFSGNASAVNWVNVSTASGYTNYTYLPNSLEYFGEDITISANTNITVSRITRFNQVRKFYWTKYTYNNYYEATITLENVIDATMQKVYVSMEFANDTTPEYYTVKCYDVTNGLYLTKGEHFDATASAIHFYIASMASGAIRRFRGEYYGRDIVLPSSDAIVNVKGYDMQEHNEKSYWYIRGQWVNKRSESFVGMITLRFNFSTHPKIIAPQSFVVYDVDNAIYLNSDDFAFTGTSLVISQEAVGSVPVNGARTFDAYFLFVNEGDEITEAMSEDVLHIGLLTVPFLNIPFEVYHLLALICLTAIIVPVKNYMDKHTATNKKYIWPAAFGAIFLFLLSFAYFA